MIRRGFARKAIVHKCQCETGTYYKLMKKDGKASCTVWIDRGCPVICDLYVSASHRRKGFATKMLDKQQEYFRTRDPKVLGESKKMERNVRNYIETVINPTLF